VTRPVRAYNRPMAADAAVLLLDRMPAATRAAT
jgi:hypothetical protein